MHVVSYNIQYGVGKDGAVDLARIAGEIGDADVIALQEVERYFEATGMVDQAVEIAAMFPGHHWIYGPGVDQDASLLGDDGAVLNRRRQFGNMLLARGPIVSSRNHLLPKFGMVGPLALQRSALEGIVETEAGPVRFYSVHLGHASAPERRLQIAKLMEIVRAAPAQGGVWSGNHAGKHWTSSGPVPPMPAAAVLLGDFNLTPDDGEYEILVGESDEKYGRLTPLDGLVDCWIAAGNDPDGGVTNPNVKHGIRIDYALATPDVIGRLKSMWVDANAVGSDHQPLHVAFDL